MLSGPATMGGVSGDAKGSPADSAGRLRGYAAVKHGAFWKHQLIRFAVEFRT